MHGYSIGHVAIIPDGNRRWARKHGKAPWLGHKEGIKAYENILKKALELNIFCISFWGMSVDNITKREALEVKFLLGYFAENLMKAIKSKDLEKHDVQISILGEWRSQFPKKLVALGEKAIAETKNRKKHIVNLLLCYDGKSEMQRAFELALKTKSPLTSPKKFLLTKDLPPVDLVIRTGGDPHLSAGFMMWDVADAQLHFSDTLWPDFTPHDFEIAVADFLKRDRRFGA